MSVLVELDTVNTQGGLEDEEYRPTGVKSESRSVVSDSLQPHGLYSLWNPLGQNTAVSSLSLLQGNLPNPGIKLGFPALQVDSLPVEPEGKPSEKTKI